MRIENTTHIMPRFLLVLLMVVITFGGATSCKSKKKIAREQAAAEYAARIEQAKKDLTAILNDETSWTLKEKEDRVATIKSWNLQDEEVVKLIDLVEDKLARERADAERKAEEERLKKMEQERIKSKESKYTGIENLLLSVAAAPDA
ncbi:MAG TPA: hypothetical protein PK939_07375, partial [Bacteroidales bacterium]|nr:hypothetical protein [Bacteroidales bacterium]